MSDIETMIDRLTERQRHEFALACAWRVNLLMTDPRSIAALDTLERWLRGEATDEEMDAARAAAWAAWAAAWAASDAADAAWAAKAASAAAWAAWVASDASDAAWAAKAASAASDASDAAWAAKAASAAWSAARASERAWQREELKRMLAEVKP